MNSDSVLIEAMNTNDNMVSAEMTKMESELARLVELFEQPINDKEAKLIKVIRAKHAAQMEAYCLLARMMENHASTLKLQAETIALQYRMNGFHQVVDTDTKGH